MTKASVYQICSIISQMKTSWNLIYWDGQKVCLGFSLAITQETPNELFGQPNTYSDNWFKRLQT